MKMNKNALAAALLLALASGAGADPGGTIQNGTNTQPTRIRADSVAAAGVPGNFFVGVGFLFEPESPYNSLKTVPIWNELEQLLDNPYAVAIDPGTFGNFDGWPSYRSTIVRRPSFSSPGATLLNPGPALPGLYVHPLNYNPTTGEEMRLLNPNYPGGSFSIPDELYLDLATDPTGNTWNWTFRNIAVTPGAGRVSGPEIDYNGPIQADPFMCVNNLELVPPEGVQLCGRDPGEPNYFGFGNLPNHSGYSTPAVPLAGPGVPGTNLSAAQRQPATPIPANKRLYDATRQTPAQGGINGFIPPRNSAGMFGLRKPSLRVPSVVAADGTPGHPTNPAYTANIDPDDVTPSNENDYARSRNMAAVLGKSLFWDMQVGSDGVQSCGTCHFNGTGTDTRTKNQVNPNHLGGDLTFQLMQPNERDLVPADFPLHKVANPDMAGDPACTTPIVANVTNVVPALDHPVSGDVTVCNAANIVSDVNDVVSSMGVHFGRFLDIAPVGTFVGAGVLAVAPDLRVPIDLANPFTVDPIPGFAGTTGNQFRRVEPRNTPTMQAAGFNFDNFWDGRARHDFNGGSVFGVADPQAHVFVGAATGPLTATRQVIKFSSIASLATGPALSEFEMSFQGRNWSKIGKKLLQAGVTPLANQLVDPSDSVLGPYSNQNGGSSACTALAAADRSGSWSGSSVAGKPGLCISYPGLIRQAYFAALWQNTDQHLVGCYTDGDAVNHPNQCAAGLVHVRQLVNGAVTDTAADPFDGYVLTPAAGASLASDTNQFTQMEGNFSLFWGLSVHLWVQLLIPDNTPFDQFLDTNPDAFMSLGDTSETLLVNDILNCGSSTPLPCFAGACPCFRESGNFKRDTNAVAHINATAEGGVGSTTVASGGTRTPGSNQPDPLLGADIFFASNLSLKNPTFRSGRCGACHNMPTLTDHTMPFTFKAQLPDFASEFTAAAPGVELLVEPLGRGRVISGFLLESEIAENGQDGVERRFINQSIAPSPVDGYAYPDGVFNPAGNYYGAAQAFIDNGVYNIGVRPIAEDIGRGGPDAFGWPLSIATLLMKNLGGADYEPNVPPNPITGAPGRGSGPMMTFDPDLGNEGGLFEESAQDQLVNPGGTDEPVNPMLPGYIAPFINGVPVGDTQPELDEPFAGINTLTDVALLEGFVDIIGPINPAAVKNEALNMAETDLMGTWPVVNRVIRDGAFKAPQLRNVELTGPYFHNGSQLTLRQVVDFYVRGGDFPITNAQHRDFLLTNLDIEAQSNLNEDEKVALVDFLLELTDERNRFDRAPFDHPEVIVPVDGLAPDNNGGRAAMLADPMYRSVAAVGATGQATPEPAFLNLTKVRVSGAAAQRGSPECDYTGSAGTGRVSHYCH